LSEVGGLLRGADFDESDQRISGQSMDDVSSVEIQLWQKMFASHYGQNPGTGSEGPAFVKLKA
jgi:hypothetical protein